MNATNTTQLDPDRAADLATILAALRFYQRAGQGEPDNRDDYIEEIATNGGAMTSLDAEGIDALCERLNAETLGAVAQLDAYNLTGIMPQG